MGKTRKFTRKLVVRMTEQEFSLLTARADAAHVSLAGFIRLLILGQTAEYHQNLDRLIYEVNKIGTNINQIAWKLNGTGYYEKGAFDECKNALTDLLREVEYGDFKTDAYEGGKGEKHVTEPEESD